jgi:hypothetical protein
MANVKLIFYGSKKSETEQHTIEVFCNTRGELFLQINSGDISSFLCFDKPTAIKFSKELRKQIALMED